MAGSSWASALLSMLLVCGAAADCGSSFLLVDPCKQNQSVAVSVCVQVGTSLTIACNVQDSSAAAWLDPNFENAAFISSSVSMMTWLNGMVELKFINQTPTCILSSATFDKVQPSVDGLNLFCRTHVPGRSGANISIIVVDDAIASVKQIAVDLTTDEKHVDIEFFHDQKCRFSKYLISKGSCSQQNDSTTIAMLEQPVMQNRISVNSFYEFCVSACTEEEVCICQEIDLNGFNVTYSQESSEETSYFVLLTFSHDVLIESVGVSPHGNGANCNANNQTSKRVMLSCFNLSNSTTYSVTVEGKASLNNSESGYQYSQFAVSINFSIAAHVKNETVDDNGLSGGTIAAISVSFFVFIILLVLIGLAVFGIIKCVNKRKNIEEATEAKEKPDANDSAKEGLATEAKEEPDANDSAKEGLATEAKEKPDANDSAKEGLAVVLEKLGSREETLQKEHEKYQKEEESLERQEETIRRKKESVQRKKKSVQKQISVTVEMKGIVELKLDK